MFSPARPSSSVCLSVSVWFLIFIITTLIIHHPFTLSLQAQHLPFQQILLHLNTSSTLDCFHDHGIHYCTWTAFSHAVCTIASKSMPDTPTALSLVLTDLVFFGIIPVS